MSNESSEARDVNNTEPPIYINAEHVTTNNILNTADTHGVFSLNGEEFVDKDILRNDLKIIDLYASKVDDSKMSELDEKTTPKRDGVDTGKLSVLQINYKKLKHGIIINSNVYLTTYQWNTLMFSEQGTVQCAVCEIDIPLEFCQSHINISEHVTNLDDFKPLELFDLSITRKIRNNYHCGVCNKLLNIQDSDDHYGTKAHEENLLLGINKASDLEDSDLNNEKAECYHFNTTSVNTIPNEKYNDEYFVDEYSNNDEKFEAFYEIDAQDLGAGYADAAKKPKELEMEKYKYIDLGEKVVKVKFDSYHMVISPSSNRFYCMVCKKEDHIRGKPAHCKDLGHLNNLLKCRVVEEFEEYFIRQVDDKFYHCGHCNNLSHIHYIGDHIEISHPKKAKNMVENSRTGVISKKEVRLSPNIKTRNNSTCDNAQTDNQNVESHDNVATLDNWKDALQNKKLSPRKASQVTNVDNLVQQNERNSLYNGPDINDDIVIFPFGYTMAISLLSYNIVCKRVEDFYCGLCDKVCVDVKSHIYELKHIQLLQKTPFIAPFGYHLTRAIRDVLHCGVCNTPVPVLNIYTHNIEVSHLELLNKALNFVRDRNLNSTNSIGTNIDSNTVCSIGTKTDSRPTNKSSIEKKTNSIAIHNISNSTKNDAHTFNSLISTKTQSNTSNISSVGSKIDFNSVHSSNGTKYVSNGTIKMDAVKELNATTDLTSKSNTDHDTKTQTVCNKNTNTENSIANDLNRIEIPRTEMIEQESMVDLNESTESFSADFDTEENVILKLGNTVVKVTNSSYNTLVNLGDIRHCFVCSQQVLIKHLQNHVDSRIHLENIEKYRFLDNYKEHFLRQIYLTYHCTLCNSLIMRRHVRNHLDWNVHIKNMEDNKNIKKQDKKNKTIIVHTAKEKIYLNEQEAKTNVFIFDKSNINAQNSEKPSKIVISNDTVLKISWENWNGIARSRDGYRCLLCQEKIPLTDLNSHTESVMHTNKLKFDFYKEFCPDLIRMINNTTLNCVTCNTELSNRSHLVKEHVHGKKHLKNFDLVLENSSQAKTYTDCTQDVLTL